MLVPTKTCDLPKPRDQMTEDDWFSYKSYKSWYKSAGIIIHSNSNVLLAQDKHTLKWSFPKGAPELMDLDSTLSTAVRECYEEVGLIHELDYTLDSEKEHSFPYESYYYMATINADKEAAAKINDDEVVQIKWMSCKDISSVWNLTNVHVKHYVKNYMRR